MKRDGLRLQHHDNRTCAPTNLPLKNSHDAAVLEHELRSAGPTQLHGNPTKRNQLANAANQKPVEAVEQLRPPTVAPAPCGLTLELSRTAKRFRLE